MFACGAYFAHYNIYRKQCQRFSPLFFFLSFSPKQTMAPQTPSRLTRRHGNATDGSHNGSINGSPSSSNKFHDASSSALSVTSTRVLAAIAALSFLVGIATTYTNSSHPLRVPKPIEAGFEPPNIRQSSRQKPRQVDSDTRQSAGQGSGDAPTLTSSRKHHFEHKRPTPRTIAVQISPHSHALTYQIPSPAIRSSAPSSIPADGHPVHPSWYESNAAHFTDGVDLDKCEPMAEWQLSTYVDCNKFHELDLQKLRMINRGCVMGIYVQYNACEYWNQMQSFHSQTLYIFIYQTFIPCQLIYQQQINNRTEHAAGRE